MRQPPQAALPAVAFLTPGAAPQRAYRLIAHWQMRKEQAKACLRAPVRLRPRGLPPPPAVLSRSSRSSPECLAGNKRWLSSAPVSSAGQWQLEGWQSEQAILPPCQKTCRLFRDRPGQQRMPNHCLDGATLLDMAYICGCLGLGIITAVDQTKFRFHGDLDSKCVQEYCRYLL